MVSEATIISMGYGLISSGVLILLRYRFLETVKTQLYPSSFKSLIVGRSISWSLWSVTPQLHSCDLCKNLLFINTSTIILLLLRSFLCDWKSRSCFTISHWNEREREIYGTFIELCLSIFPRLPHSFFNCPVPWVLYSFLWWLRELKKNREYIRTDPCSLRILVLRGRPYLLFVVLVFSDEKDQFP